MKAQISETGERKAGSGSDSWVEVIRQQVGSLRFGVVQVVVHESRVVQIERTERVRFDKPAAETT